MKQWLFLMVLITCHVQAFEPCKPFCDMGCSVPAIIEMAATVSAGYSEMTSLNQSLNAHLLSVDAAVVEQGAALGGAWFEQLQWSLSGLDAQTNVWLLSTLMQAKSMAENTDNITQNFYASLRAKALAARVNDNNQTYRQNTMPQSGELLTNKAASHKTGRKKAAALHRQLMAQFMAYSTESAGADQGIAASIRTGFDASTFDIHAFITADTVDDQTFKAYQDLLMFVVNTNPLIATGNSLNAKTHLVKLALVMNVMVGLLVDKAQTLPTDWVQSYMAKTSAFAAISETETLHGLVSGRLSAPGYFLDIKALSGAGLQRELTYLKAEENELLRQSNQNKQHKNTLLLVGLMQTLNDEAAVLSTDRGRRSP
jgi:hypothetical protein